MPIFSCSQRYPFGRASVERLVRRPKLAQLFQCLYIAFTDLAWVILTIPAPLARIYILIPILRIAGIPLLYPKMMTISRFGGDIGRSCSTQK